MLKAWVTSLTLHCLLMGILIASFAFERLPSYSKKPGLLFEIDHPSAKTLAPPPLKSNTKTMEQTQTATPDTSALSPVAQTEFPTGDRDSVPMTRVKLSFVEELRIAIEIKKNTQPPRARENKVVPIEFKLSGL